MAKHKTIKRKKDWAFIKDKVDNSGLVLDYEEKKDSYKVFAMDGNTKYFTNIFSPSHRRVVGQSSTNAADYTDFIDNYKDVIDGAPPIHADAVTMPDIALTGDKLQIHESSRPDSTGKEYVTVWTGAGDDLDTDEIGAGTLGHLHIPEGTGITQTSIDMRFTDTYGEVWVHEGYIKWTDGQHGDNITAMVMCDASPMQTDTNLDYVVHADGIRYAYSESGPGTGTHGFAGTPVFYPNRGGTGLWDLDSSGNPVPNFGETGIYDFGNTEQVVQKFFNKIPVDGTCNSYTKMQSADSSLIPNRNYFIRVTAESDQATAAHEWYFSFMITVYREITVSY